MKYAEIMERIKEIDGMNPEDMSLEELKTVNEERASLEVKRTDYETEGDKMKELRTKVANDTTLKVIKKFDNEEQEDRNMDKFEVEYRSAFLKKLLNEKLTDVEERAYLHTTANTDAVIPKELQNQIYSNMEESHPILKDVQVLRTGAVISIAKHVSIDAGDAKIVGEGVANDDEQNTFVNVSLSGKDFSKHVDFSYRLGQLSIPAFEQYLVKEISDRLGSAMADDIVVQIENDLHVDNKMNVAEAGTLDITDVLSGLASLKGVSNSTVYVNPATFYNNIARLKDATGMISFISDYTQGIAGQLLGRAIKLEDSVAEGDVLILDPKQFIYNVVQDIMLERDRDIKKHTHTIAGFAIAEGTLTNDKAGAIITVGDGL